MRRLVKKPTFGNKSVFGICLVIGLHATCASTSHAHKSINQWSRLFSVWPLTSMAINNDGHWPWYWAIRLYVLQQCIEVHLILNLYAVFRYRSAHCTHRGEDADDSKLKRSNSFINKHNCSIERGFIQCSNRNQNMHISKIRLLFLVSFTIEYKVGIAEFYLYMGFGADLLTNVVTRA